VSDLGQINQSLVASYWAVRRFSDQLCAALTPEDQVIQSMPDASPAKWHRAHTSWFFEQFVLVPHMADYQPFSREFSYLFNSYYETVGARHPRFARGLITRPGVADVDAYRAYVDDAMARLLATDGGLGDLVTLGLHHEQQHQELLVTDMLHGFAENPLLPTMIPGWQAPEPSLVPDEMIAFDRRLIQVGHSEPSFAFDNEGPPHEALVLPFKLGRRLVRNAAWLEFMADGGYRTPTLWMSDGWSAAVDGGWQAPLHWRQRDGIWLQFGPGGEVALNPDKAVRHVSWYEADAFARWAGARLPTEFEWESAYRDPRFAELDGHVWQWTNSAYLPYPGFRPVEGAIGEYNGKFMINTMVLRGSSMATPPGHARLTYRNFFHPEKRWQFTGLRLAADLS